MTRLLVENIPYLVAGVGGLFMVVLGYVSIIENLRDGRETRDAHR